jgi:sigma-B regulation protein RsbU (phosphoserine phosphatase)
MSRQRRSFWNRISDGVAIQQMWAQFEADARAGYALYSKEVDWTREEGESKWKRFWRIARALFWAMVMKLSPGRRVLLLFAMVCLWFPGLQIRVGEIEVRSDNLAFLGGIVLLVLLALELADRVTMKRDLEIAREIQSWLMPEAAPEVPGVEIAFTTRPANTVAGDYYDAFYRSSTGRSDDGSRLLLVVADVAGKSVPAALVMATLQASLRTLAALPGSLLELVGRLNRYACAQNMSGRRFTTAFLAELDPATGSLEYVNAGHNWPVLLRASGAVERLDVGGLPLGIMADVPYQCGLTKLEPGDLMLIFTDGLVEAENKEAQEFGESRMMGGLHSVKGATAHEVLKHLMASVDAFVGLTRQHDDITCLVLRRHASAGAAV